MFKQSLKRTNSIACVDLTTGKSIQGIIGFNEQDILELNLTSFFGDFEAYRHDTIDLALENTKYMTLRGCVMSSHNKKFHFIEPNRTTYSTCILSNMGIVGPSLWQEHDHALIVRFSIPEAAYVLQSRNHIINAMKVGTDEWNPNSILLSFDVPGGQAKIFYASKLTSSSVVAEEVEPRFEIEFSEKKTLQDVQYVINGIVSFFSFCMGIPMSPTNIMINKHSETEIEEAINSNIVLDDHEVVGQYRQFPIDDVEIESATSPFNASEPDSLLLFKDAITLWLQRQDQWFEAYSVLMGTLKHRRSISGDRLISACRWLEEIPDVASINVMNEVEFLQIVSAARFAAKSLGLTSLNDRISNGLKNIKKETSKQRFHRICSELKLTSKYGIEHQSMVRKLANALAIRGRVAHRSYSGKITEELNESILAIEALCFLLTVRDLPSDDKSLILIKKHRMVDMYRMLAASRRQ